MKKIRTMALVIIMTTMLTGCPLLDNIESAREANEEKNQQETNQNDSGDSSGLDEAEDTDKESDTESGSKDDSYVDDNSNDGLTLGEVKDGFYINQFFDIELALPDAWEVMSEEQIAMIVGAGADLIESSNSELADELKLEEQEVLYLLGMFKYPLEEQHTINPNIMITAEKLDESTGIQTADQYLDHSLELLMETGLSYTFEDERTEVTGTGHTFSKVHGNVDTGSFLLYQDYYIVLTQGYAINIITTYSTVDGISEIGNLIE